MQAPGAPQSTVQRPQPDPVKIRSVTFLWEE